MSPPRWTAPLTAGAPGVGCSFSAAPASPPSPSGPPPSLGATRHQHWHRTSCGGFRR
uniref:Uncharacterized protein n=1 Tax=Anguilla anguilla TaxID=7936 RepID=A0A0E9TCT8_ANGAN